MRQGPNNKRMRGRGGNGRKHSNPRNQTFESNGPDVKVRGNAQQVVEKYLALARDASSAGDRISAESYYQYAEHYYRIMNANLAHEQRQQMPSVDGSSFDDSDQDQDDLPGGDNGYDRHHQGGGQHMQRQDQDDAGDDDEGVDVAEASGDGQRQPQNQPQNQNPNQNGNGHGGGRRRGGRNNGRRRDGGNQPDAEAAGGDAAPAPAGDAGEGVGA